MVSASDTDVIMPIWLPPRPPSPGDAVVTPLDIYMEPCAMLLYEETPMSEAQLPPVYLSPPPCERTMSYQANKRRRDDSITDVVSSVHNRVCNNTDTPSQKRDRLADLLQKPSTPLPTSQQKQLTPRSLFDSGKRRPPSPPPPHNEDMIYEGPEWSIIEDYIMLHVLKEEQGMAYNLISTNLGHIPNWKQVSIEVSRLMGHYRSPRQCAIRYMLVVLPREEHRLVAHDPVTRKARRCPLSEHETNHMKKGRLRTDDQFDYESKVVIKQRLTARARTMTAAHMTRKNQPDSRSRQWMSPNVSPTQFSLEELKCIAAYHIDHTQTYTPQQLAEERQRRYMRKRQQERQDKLKAQQQAKQDAAEQQRQQVYETQQPQQTQPTQPMHTVQYQQRPTMVQQVQPSYQRTAPTVGYVVAPTPVQHDYTGPAAPAVQTTPSTYAQQMPTTTRLLQTSTAHRAPPAQRTNVAATVHSVVSQVQQQQPGETNEAQPTPVAQPQATHQQPQPTQQPAACTVVITSQPQGASAFNTRPSRPGYHRQIVNVKSTRPASGASFTPVSARTQLTGGQSAHTTVTYAPTTYVTQSATTMHTARATISQADTSSAQSTSSGVASNTPQLITRHLPVLSTNQSSIRPKVHVYSQANPQTYTRMVVTSTGADTSGQRSYVLHGARDARQHPDQSRRVQVRQTRVHQLRGANLHMTRRSQQSAPKIHTIARGVLVHPQGGQAVTRLAPRATLVRQSNAQSGQTRFPSINVIMPAVRQDNTSQQGTTQQSQAQPSGAQASSASAVVVARPQPPSSNASSTTTSEQSNTQQ